MIAVLAQALHRVRKESFSPVASIVLGSFHYFQFDPDFFNSVSVEQVWREALAHLSAFFAGGAECVPQRRLHAINNTRPAVKAESVAKVAAQNFLHALALVL